MADHGTEDNFDIAFTEALRDRQETEAIDRAVFQAAGLEDARDALDATFTPEELAQTSEDAPGVPFGSAPDGSLTDGDIGFLGTVADVGEQLIGGVRDAGVNTLQTVADVGGLLDSGINFDELIPNVDPAETGVGAFARGTATFLTGFIPVLGAMRALRATKAVAGLLTTTRASGAAGRLATGEIAKFTVAGAITDFAVFDPHAERLSNLAVEYGFDNAIFKALSAHPDDGEFTGRLKSVIEGAGLGLLADGILNGVRFSARWAKTQRSIADEVAIAPAARAAVHASGAKVTFLRQHYADLKAIREDWAALGRTSGDETVALARTQLDKGGGSTSTPAGGGQPLPHELDAAGASRLARLASASDAQQEVEFFGEEGAKRYRLLRRQSNSTNDVKANRAADELAQMEDTLTPQEQDIFFGRNETGLNAEDLEVLARSLQRVNTTATVEGLARELRVAITNLPEPGSSPSQWTFKQQEAVGMFREAFKVIEREGLDSKAVTDLTIRQAAGRFSEEADAEFMLRAFLKPTGASPTTSANELIQLAELRSGQSGRTVREEFDDIAAPMDEAAAAQSPLGLIEGEAPELSGDIKRLSGNLDELDGQIERAFDDLGVAEEEFYEAVTLDEWRLLFDDQRLPAERIVDRFVPKGIEKEVKEFRRFLDEANCPL